MDANIGKLNTDISTLNADISQMNIATSAIFSTQEEMEGHVDKLGEKLHAEVVEIEDKMEATNRLLTQKFDKFSELLKKSNTEALVQFYRSTIMVTAAGTATTSSQISILQKYDYGQIVSPVVLSGRRNFNSTEVRLWLKNTSSPSFLCVYFNSTEVRLW